MKFFTKGVVKMANQNLKIFTLADLETKKSQLEKLEPKEKKISTKREIVLFMKETIQGLIKKNYDLEEISEILKNMNIDVSVNFLRKILEENNVKKNKKISKTKIQEKNKIKNLEEKNNAKFNFSEDTEL